MRIHPAEQGSGEWLAARSTILTASNFGNLLTPAKLEYSKQASNHLKLIAAARLWSVYEDTVSTPAMERGLELEAEARAAYEMLTGATVEEVGLCIDDDLQAGASPDGLIGEDGGLEIKCPGLAQHLDNLLAGEMPGKYKMQVQGCLLVTGRKWWDFMSYYPGCPPMLDRVLPDPELHRKLRDALCKFNLDLSAMIDSLKANE